MCEGSAVLCSARVIMTFSPCFMVLIDFKKIVELPTTHLHHGSKLRTASHVAAAILRLRKALQRHQFWRIFQRKEPKDMNLIFKLRNIYFEIRKSVFF